MVEESIRVSRGDRQVSIAVRESGSGPAILFSHGFLLDGEMFAAQVKALQDQWRCVIWDQRGFGKTGSVHEPFTYWDSAADALHILDALDIPDAIFVGLSQGAFLSMRAALVAPDRVRGLVLISTRSGRDSDETNAGLEALGVEWHANGSENLGDGLTDLLIGDAAHAAPWRDKWSAMERSALQEPLNALIGRDDITPRLDEITCPTLVIHGSADPGIDPLHGEELARSIASAEFVRVAGAGHAPTLTHATEVNAAIQHFLNDHFR